MSKKLVVLKNRARKLDIHNKDLEIKQNSGFWFKIPQHNGDRPLLAYIRRTNATQFSLYICYDREYGIHKDRLFGLGGTDNPTPHKVTVALNALFNCAFGDTGQRKRPAPPKNSELPLFANLADEEDEEVTETSAHLELAPAI